jgi:hypothetical protein
MSQGEVGTNGASEGAVRLVTKCFAAFISLAVVLAHAAPAAAAYLPDTVAEDGRISPYWGGAISQWNRAIVYWAAERELDADLVAAVVRSESIGQANAEGPFGAVGLMMVLPAEVSGLAWRPTAEELKQPNVNLRWGTGILKQILRDSDGDLFKALAAYNGGWEQTHLPSTKRYAQTVLDFYANAIAARHGYSYQESKSWTMVFMTRVDGFITYMTAHSSSDTPQPCFGGAIAFRRLFPEMVTAPRTQVTRFTNQDGSEVAVDAWLFLGEPNTPADQAFVRAAPLEVTLVGHRP